MRASGSLPASLVLAAALAACGKGYTDLGTFPCAQDKSCPAAYLCIQGQCLSAEQCDPVNAQSGCHEADRAKCTLVSSGSGSSQKFVSQCVPPQAAALADGVACAASSGYSAVDPCQNTSICYTPGTAQGAEDPGRCRRFCRADTDCLGTDRCVDAFPGPRYDIAQQRTGVCMPVCDVFNNSCSGHCDALPSLEVAKGVPICRTNGNVAELGNCATDNCQNASNLICVPGAGGPTCRKACDATHLCASGTCHTSQYSLGGSVSYCQ